MSDLTAKEAYEKSFKIRFSHFNKIMEKIDSSVNCGYFYMEYTSLIEHDIILKLEKLGYEIDYNDKEELITIKWSHFR